MFFGIGGLQKGKDNKGKKRHTAHGMIGSEVSHGVDKTASLPKLLWSSG